VLQTIHGRAETIDLQLMRTLKNSAKGQKGQFQSSSAPTHPAPLILDLVRRNQLPLTTERLRKLAGDNVPGKARTNTVAERRRKKSTHPFAALRNLPSGSAWPFDLGLWTLAFGPWPLAFSPQVIAIQRAQAESNHISRGGRVLKSRSTMPIRVTISKAKIRSI
jgi:hypothetical protein